MKIRNATAKDIDSIMFIEKKSFISEIQENRETFENRIKVFPEGFVVFENSLDSGEIVATFGKENQSATSEDNRISQMAQNNTSQIFGYFCSEKWNAFPTEAKNQLELFTLGHSAEKSHSVDGKILYISSFAILSEFRGKRLGKKLFKKSLEFILENPVNKNVETLILLVNEQWNSALHIYENYGFKTVRKIAGIFPEDCGIIMEKSVGSSEGNS